ncbi:unnamed protein product [Cylicostephanus goldi]|uniref:Peptidase S9 prolyl oligopeptidase catalytic domain-containing protein n=1 Tax=Cylicostephanus goldi TaxID=71465 RepID=A0A3P6RE43_CYLGO|nr:unnamed protein product [Cylicostephanus goldi]
MVAPFTSGLRLFGRKPAEVNTSKLDRFVTYDKMPKVHVPVLVCHGAADEAIPVEHGLTITKRAPRAVTPLFIQGADHMSVFNGKYLQTFRRIRKSVNSPIISRNLWMKKLTLHVLKNLVTAQMNEDFLKY